MQGIVNIFVFVYLFLITLYQYKQTGGNEKITAAENIY